MPRHQNAARIAAENACAPKAFWSELLTDQGVISAIARAINPQKDDNVVEIGPGQGALTDALLKVVVPSKRLK